MLTAKQYKQKWLAFKSKNRNASRMQIWGFQKSILSSSEQRLADNFELYLDKNDPRHEAMDLSDKAWNSVSL